MRQAALAQRIRGKGMQTRMQAPGPAQTDRVGEPAAVAVLIGRFQPFHRGHQALLERALAEGSRVVVVLGSAMLARSPKNPFTWEERAAMVRAAAGEQAHRVDCLPVRDHHDDERWLREVVAGVDAAVRRVAAGASATGTTGTVGSGARTDVAIRLIGHRKDATSEYLNRFGSWDLVLESRRPELDAAPIRRVLFGGAPVASVLAVLSQYLPGPVHDFLRAWIELPFHRRLTEEWLGIRREREQWSGAPREPVFVTVDALVRARDRVLLVRRAGAPGAGLWALPGGFVEPHERVRQAAIRELREETGIGLLQVSLDDAFRAVQVFDHPQRAARGRTITHVHFFDLGGHPPEVRGASDASEAAWIPVAELAGMQTELFEDHFAILDHFLGLDRPADGQGHRPAGKLSASAP
jgi:bifunctional NMN adenylyltransferase/nudix hydrolase